MGGEGSGVRGHHTSAAVAAPHIAMMGCAVGNNATNQTMGIFGQFETSRLTVVTQGTPERIFLTATQKPSETDWLTPSPRGTIQQATLR